MSEAFSDSNAVELFFKKTIYFLFFFFVFYPYISFVDIGTDMQPYSIILAAVIFFMFRVRLTYNQLFIALIFLYSFFVLLTSGLSFTSFRSFFNYSSLFFISYATFKVLREERLNFELFLKSSIIIWLLVGMVQTLYSRTFLNFIISGSRTTDSRGVVGLAPEPTFYGIVLIFFIIFLLHMEVKNKKFYILSCITGIVFFAQSSMAVLFLLIMSFFYLLTHFKFKYLVFFVVSLFLVPALLVDLLPTTRLSFLINKILEEPEALILIDASINDRFFHVFFSLKGMFDNYLFPNGFQSWNIYVSEQLPQYSDVVIVEWFSVGGRIMSGYGAAFFELGFIAVFIPVAMFGLLYSIYRNNVKKLMFFFLFVNAIMFSAIPIGFSLFGFYLGFLGYLSWKKTRIRVCYV